MWMTPFSGPIVAVATADFVNSETGGWESRDFVPTELRVCGKVRPYLVHIGEEVLDFLTNDTICHIMDRLENPSGRLFNVYALCIMGYPNREMNPSVRCHYRAQS